MITLKIFREQKGLTQLDLARRVGITQPEISLMESGYLKPKTEVLVRISEVLGLLPGEVLMPYEEYLKQKGVKS